MTLPASGQLDMNSINVEFGRGLNLNAYRGTPWYTDAGGSGTFSAGQISMGEFYGKRLTSPISNGLISLQGNGGGGPGWSWSSGLGTEHANRVIVACVATGDTTGSPMAYTRIDGVNMTLAARSSGTGSMRAVSVYYMSKPTGTTATITAANANNASGAILAIFAIYPASPTPASADPGATTATSCSSTLTLPAGGFGVFVGHHRNTNATTMGGTLAVSHNVHYNATFGGVNMIFTSFTSGGAVSGTAMSSWGGAVNGSCAGATWGPN